VRHQHQLAGAEAVIERADDGVQVARLVGGGVRVAGRLVRAAPAQEVEADDGPAPGQLRDQPVVQVGAVGKAVHQHHRRSASGRQLGM
jgi:hypothetical protein